MPAKVPSELDLVPVSLGGSQNQKGWCKWEAAPDPGEGAVKPALLLLDCTSDQVGRDLRASTGIPCSHEVFLFSFVFPPFLFSSGSDFLQEDEK